MYLPILLLLVGSATAAAATDTTLVARGSTWRYFDAGISPGADWPTATFDDSAWNTGPAKLGYGDGDESTVVSYGPNASTKHTTTYFRSAFSVADPAGIARLTLRLRRDDGAVVYVNGTEVHRTNLPAGAVDHSTWATAAVAGADETHFFPVQLDPAVLTAGTNAVAVEVHQVNGTSSDLGFDLELEASDVPYSVTRGPYWQMATPTSLVVRWRTDVATNSRVRFGTAPDALVNTTTDPTLTTEHSVALTGLTPDTSYYFAIGSTDADVAGPDASHVVRTPPAAGTSRPARIWVIGDAGTGDGSQAAVRDAYVAHTAARPADLWLMLGDNAYDSGTDSEYQAGVFDMYPEQLRSAPVWPTFGNHDAGSANSATQTGVYFDIFTLPTLGEAGGEPSGTEAYYSFDHGNIHFVCLDSMGSSRLPGSAMLTWLEADLEATQAQWVIAFWHHPPYSKGSHDSDAETTLIQMRQNVVPILEDHGVDLVLAGHSHSYERSYLLDGHYGVSSTLQTSMLVDDGDGRADGSGAYRKTGTSLVPHEGAVYVVAGSSGKLDAVGRHPAMFAAWSELGSVLLDIDGRRLDASFLNADGEIRDWFRIAKTSAACDPAPRAGCRIAQRSTLSVRNRSTDASDALAWTWLRGEATALADFGAPTADTDYALCIYDDNGRISQIDIPASPATWTGARSAFRFSDRSGSADGARRLGLKSGETNRAAVRLKAGGAALPELGMPLAGPVTVQLVRSGAPTCWGARYAGDEVSTNTAEALKARTSLP